MIKDLDNLVFGAFLSQSWKSSTGFYGNGESFIFKFNSSNEIIPYFWTEKNSYFLLSNEETGFAIGVG